MWVTMVSISIVLFLFQASIDAVSTDPTTLYDYNGSIIQAYDTGGYNQEIDPNTGIPVIPAEVTSTGGDSGFTDIFNSIKSWFQDSKSGKIIGGLYYAVPNVLKGMGMPPVFSFALGLFWTLLAIFSFVLFMRGVG